MDAEMLLILITGGTALVGSLGTAGFTLLKYKDAKQKEADAEENQFYLYTASNLVRESERLFGEGKGNEKKIYAMTRLQNEAQSSGVAWNPKVASLSLEKAVTLRNDYKNMEVSMSDIIKKETDIEEESQAIQENLQSDLGAIGKTASGITKNILLRTKKKKVSEESVIGVIED